MMAYASWSVVFGEQPSAAKWNILGTNDASFNDGTGIANIRYGSGFTSKRVDYKFSVYRTTALNSSSTPTAVAFDTKIFDTSTNIDVVTNKGRFTAPVTGFFWFAGLAGNTGATATLMIASLYKNGSSVKNGAVINPGNANTRQLATSLLSLTSSDYVELYYTGGSGSAMAVGQTDCWFDGALFSNT